MARKKDLSLTSAIGKELGVDFGTVNTVIYLNGKGVIVREPSLIAVDNKTQDILAVGKEAKEMVGRNPQSIKLLRPVANGVVYSFDSATVFLKALLKKSASTGVGRGRMILSHPYGATEVEKLALEEVGRASGAVDISLLDAPIAALIGEGVAPVTPTGQMIIDMGAGHTEVSVCIFGEIVSSFCERTGALDIDQSIIRFMKLKYNLLISDLTAEQVKLKVGNAVTHGINSQVFMDVKGRSIVDGLPKSVNVSSEEIREPIIQALSVINRLVVKASEDLPPQIAADILESDVIVTGGGSLLKGLKEYIEESCGLKARLSERPFDTVAEGLGKAFAQAIEQNK